MTLGARPHRSIQRAAHFLTPISQVSAQRGSTGRPPAPVVLGWIVASTIAAAIAFASPDCGASDGPAVVTCTNVVSGASWQIRIDYGRKTVDSNPAEISDSEISWHDASDGGNYTLDRKSGNLTVIFASSTGGYFLHHRCRLQN